MDLRTIFKNLWLAFTVFAFFMGGYFISSQHYKEVIEVKERRHSQELARVKAEAELKIEHFQREAAESANRAIEEQAKKSREKEIEIYQQMANLQKKFTDNRTLIKRLHDNQSALCERGLLDSDTCNRQLQECRQLLTEGADLVGESIETLQQQRVLSGKGGK